MPEIVQLVPDADPQRVVADGRRILLDEWQRDGIAVVPAALLAP